jgi:hypothetical protein
VVVIWEFVAMEKILVYVMAIWSILHQCGICYGHLVFFSFGILFHFLVCCTKKNVSGHAFRYVAFYALHQAGKRPHSDQKHFSEKL